MFNRAWLSEFLFQTGRVANLRAVCREILAGYPANGCALTCSRLLSGAGVDVPDILWAEDLAGHLLSHCKGRKTKNPQFGDVFVSKDLNGNGAADHIGLWIAPTGAESFLALDNRGVGGLENGVAVPGTSLVLPVYVRNAGRGRFTPVDYYISLP